MEGVVVFVTASDTGEAERIGAALLEARLAACVSVIPQVDSRFWWQGQIESAREALLLIKTRRDLFPRLLEAVRAVHSYHVFEAVAVPISEANPDYLRWIGEATQVSEPNGRAA
ncbi:MAG: divalent-cation tolerance protein CutA [Armatimonadetes bacterium]|nr:divalent-cation tolerance protein CutA [Armatimonadota bacterium]